MNIRTEQIDNECVPNNFKPWEGDTIYYFLAMILSKKKVDPQRQRLQCCYVRSLLHVTILLLFMFTEVDNRLRSFVDKNISWIFYFNKRSKPNTNVILNPIR